MAFTLTLGIAATELAALGVTPVQLGVPASWGATLPVSENASYLVNTKSLKKEWDPPWVCMAPASGSSCTTVM